MSKKTNYNKCVGDDTKTTAHQSVNCIKNKKNKIWRKTIFSMRDGILTPCNVARSRHWFRQVTAAWHVALESRQWIHQVAAPCNVTRGSGMTCHWIRPNVCHIGILHLVSIFTHHRSRRVILYQSVKFYLNQGRKKWCHVDFQDGGSPPSWILVVPWWVLWKTHMRLPIGRQ